MDIYVPPPAFGETPMPEEYFPMVDQLADVFSRKFPQIPRDDLRQEGMVGLMKAVRNYDPGQRLTFGGYAKQRVRGAILDYVELHCRDQRRMVVMDPEDFSDVMALGGGDTPEDTLVREQFVKRVRSLLCDETIFTERQRQVGLAYYFRMETERKIADALGRRNGRVNDILMRVCSRLRRHLSDLV